VDAAVHESGNITIENFDAASKIIHDHASADANLFVGLISEDQMGRNVKVTILMVHQT
jgi:cell division protein FtsZ